MFENMVEKLYFWTNFGPIDMFKQNEILLRICYSTQKSDLGTVVGLGNILYL